jgi:hypothetical protein
MDAEVIEIIEVLGDKIQHVAETIVLSLHASVKFDAGLGALAVWTVGEVVADLYKQSSAFIQDALQLLKCELRVMSENRTDLGVTGREAGDK